MSMISPGLASTRPSSGREPAADPPGRSSIPTSPFHAQGTQAPRALAQQRCRHRSKAPEHHSRYEHRGADHESSRTRVPGRPILRLPSRASTS
jgi:hypothetical protein